MIVDIWTIVNPIIRTFIYLNALYSIGTILFKFHFQKYFNHQINSFCNKIIKNSAFLGLSISILAKMLIERPKNALFFIILLQKELI